MNFFKIGSQVLNVEPTWLRVEPWDEKKEDVLIQPWMIFIIINCSERSCKKGTPILDKIAYEVIDYKLRRGWVSEKDLIGA